MHLIRFITCNVLLIVLLKTPCFAQTLTRDQKVAAALHDVENFKLNKVDLKRFRNDRDNYRPMPPRPGFTLLHPPIPTSRQMTDFNKMRAKKDTIDYYAPWFLPTKQTTADTSLLADSVYVQYYRAAAYQKTVARKPARYYLAVTGIAIGAAAVIATTVAVIVVISKIGS